jgi:hypothetical protein
MYFVEREGADAKLCKLDVDAYGRVKNWPNKFFGDALGETKEQARLMFERQKQELLVQVSQEQQPCPHWLF